MFGLDRTDKQIMYQKEDREPGSNEKPHYSQLAREEVLQWCKTVLEHHHPIYDEKTVNHLLEITAELFYFILFIVLKRHIHKDRLKLAACAALYLALIYYVKQTVHEKKLGQLGTRFFEELSESSGYPPDEINAAVLLIINEHRSTVEQTAAKLSQRNNSTVKILGHGSFGLVCHPAFSDCHPITGNMIHHPEESAVTKIFFNEDMYQKALRNYEKIASLMNDPIYKASAHSRRTFSNLPQKLSQRVHSYSRKKIKPTSDVYAIKMPHLGTSIHRVIRNAEEREAFQGCDFYLLLGELYKCHAQLHRLFTQQYIHGDIRTPNVMWNKNTCGLHIIDFDFLDTAYEFTKKHWSHFGSTHHPPECLLISSQPKRTSEWLDKNYPMFRELYYRNHILGKPNRTSEEFDQMIQAAQKKNQIRIQPALSEASNDAKYRSFAEIEIPYFDGYSFALIIATLLGVIYPQSMNYTENVEDIQKKTRYLEKSLKGILPSSYSVPYHRLVVKTIVYLSEIYQEMLFFDMTERTTIDVSFAQMKEVYEEFSKRHHELMSKKGGRRYTRRSK